MQHFAPLNMPLVKVSRNINGTFGHRLFSSSKGMCQCAYIHFRHTWLNNSPIRAIAIREVGRWSPRAHVALPLADYLRENPREAVPIRREGAQEVGSEPRLNDIAEPARIECGRSRRLRGL
jgi:hypothetical protein